ncbi:MAG TPA: HAMP domain-containing sensor histidine kinase [Thermoanaerobaculia bacterium]|nr:HAMP domain-containing sensor histidine kinase [Thermoanaerobaculia bacterium]
MRMPKRANALLAILLLLLVAGLGVLATLQYRWIDRVSDAERERMHANLDFAARRLGGELGEEIGSLFVLYSRDQMPVTTPALVETTYLLEHRDDGWHLLDEDGREASWPPKLEPVRASLPASFEQRPRWGGPLFGSIPALFVLQQPDRPPPGFGLAPNAMPNAMRFARPHPPQVRIVVLSRRVLTESVMPRLVQRHFSSADAAYEVALVSGSSVLYRSSTNWPDGKQEPDAQAGVLAPFGAGGPRDERRGPRDERRGPAPGDRRERPPLRIGGGEPPPPHGDEWRILVRRSNGGLEATIDSARRRNLALNITILMILVATIVTLLVLLRRADRLRAQQTEFVAAMSHELNTPIAAMRAAGENLKDGIIVEKEKLARYGETIVRESARLGDMVAQVLEFAGMQAHTSRRNRAPVDVPSVVEDAVGQARALTLGTPIEIALEIAPGLPPVSGDAASLTRAVYNLVANAIRHGGGGNWVGVSAKADERDAIVIQVDDRGEGIDPRDAAHLFEPFFRGRNSGGVRGAGLGLAIVKQIVEDHGGSVAVQRRREEGSSFTMRIPAGHE